jgi:hypothetical protein
MIFLSKNGEDRYINDFAHGCGSVPVSTELFDYNSSDEPIVLRGILKHKIMKQCWRDKRTFYYMDTGYFGNEGTWKFWHRIVKNDLQHTDIIKRPDDRFKQFKKTIHPWRHGSKILIAMPDEKPCKFYDTTPERWLAETVNTLKQYTDRPIEIRERAKQRTERMLDTLEQALSKDVHALVTFNSVAATESVFYGVPVFTLAPNAAQPMGLQDLTKIETPYYPSDNKRYAWACHLAYGQFHLRELKDGSAKQKLEEWYE